MSTSPKIPTLKLSSGQSMPQVGLGLWKVTDEDEFNTMFDAALAAGYRHFDTAQAYHNEMLLGAALKRSKEARNKLFITTKIAVEHFGYKKAKSTFNTSLKSLDTEYVDLLLLHFPVPLLRKASWKALEGIQSSGQAKAIGVSNYTIRHLEHMETYAKVMPAVNQVELHVFLQQPELLTYCRKHNIVVEAYSPLAHSKSMDNKAIASIAEKHRKSYAQIMLRWCIEQGLVVIPKSVTPSRIQENINLFDFKLDQEDLTLLAQQNKNLRTCWDPTHIP